MDVTQHMQFIAKQLAHELQLVAGMKEVTSSPPLLGAYAEAAVRRLVHRMVSPMRVCSGAILDFPQPDKLRQIDAIIWAPYPAPAILEAEGFGLVPRSSAFGVLEIKRSNYPKATKELQTFAATFPKAKPVLLGADDFSTNITPGMGVVCVLENKVSERLASLFDSQRAVAIIKAIDGRKLVVCAEGILRLINFLGTVGWRYHQQMAYPQFPLLSADLASAGSKYYL